MIYYVSISNTLYRFILYHYESLVKMFQSGIIHAVSKRRRDCIVQCG